MKLNRFFFWVLLLGTTLILMNQKNVDQVPPTGNSYALRVEPKINLFDEVEVEIFNQSDQELIVKNNCPYPPLIIERYQEDSFSDISQVKTNDRFCENLTDYLIQAKGKTLISFSLWNRELFDRIGRYRVYLPHPQDQKKYIYSNEFEIVERGFFSSLWVKAFYQPIYNVLVLLIKGTPYHSLGLAIIALTLLIRMILLAPNKKAIESQKKINELQPKLNAIKEKYSANQQKQAEETLKLWKQNKVNPFGSCLPILIQFPIMIALYWVVRSGLSIHNEVLIYDFIGEFNLSEVNSYFLGMDLRLSNLFFLPLLVGFLQYVQMRYTLVSRQKKGTKKSKKSKNDFDQMELMNKMMLYFMPVMIAVFTASLPAGVGLYWGTSTLFGIGQQWFIFRGQ